MALRMRPPMSLSASSQLTSTNSPEPRFPLRELAMKQAAEVQAPH
jgi:hypothetical protein